MSIRLSNEQKMMSLWWVRMVFGLIFLGISYALISLALDSARTGEYLFGFLFLWVASRELINAFKTLRTL